jgi:hypothetical protein
MRESLRFGLAGILAAGLLVGCGEPPPPKPPPAPEPAPEPDPPPPPPPKCEALKEHCQADADTKVPVPGLDLTFTPAKDWTYAKLEEATVAQVGDKGAVLVLTSIEPEKGFKANKQRNDQATSLAELVLIEPPGKIALFQPNMRRDIAGLKMQLWERANAKRGEDTGGMLVIAATVGERELFGIGFAPKDDQEGTAAILGMLETLSEGGGDKGDDDDGGGGEDEKK